MEKHPKLKIERPRLAFEEQVIFDLYNRVINPMNQNIDWDGFFMWCAIKDIDHVEETADLMLIMRSHYNEVSKNRDVRKKKVEGQQQVHNELLKKKFGG